MDTTYIARSPLVARDTPVARDAHSEFPSLHPFPSLEERIRQAHAERSVEVGYAIGAFLAAAWRLAVHR
jgi:hypothetical protein